FIDTVSISLPLHMIKASQDRGRNEDSEELRRFSSELNRLYEQDESIIVEFNEIIEMMFCLNFKFNFILSFYAAIRRCRFSIRYSPGEVGGGYLGYKYQH
ncbi:hypothetical protein LWT23_22725, partial [Enterobacter hormaechei]|nr:hypothetical protein [Enterobacter hormaechei]